MCASTYIIRSVTMHWYHVTNNGAGIDISGCIRYLLLYTSVDDVSTYAAMAQMTCMRAESAGGGAVRRQTLRPALARARKESRTAVVFLLSPVLLIVSGVATRKSGRVRPETSRDGVVDSVIDETAVPGIWQGFGWDAGIRRNQSRHPSESRAKVFRSEARAAAS